METIFKTFNPYNQSIYVENDYKDHTQYNQTVQKNFGDVVRNNLSLVLLLISVIYCYHKIFKRKGKSVNDWNKNEKQILGPADLPQLKTWLPYERIIGSIPKVLPLSDLATKSLKWSEEFGDVFTAYALNETFVTLMSAPLIQAMTKSSDFGHVAKSPFVYGPFEPFIKNGVVVSKATYWQKQRKILMKSQNFQNLKTYVGMLNRHGGNLVQDLEKLFQDGKPHQISVLISTTFLGVATEMITGKNMYGSNELEEYRHNLETWKEILSIRIILPFLLFKPIWMLYPRSREYDNAAKELIDFSKRRVKEHKMIRAHETLNSADDGAGNKPKHRTMLDDLIDAGVEEAQIVDELNTVTFAGHETAAATIHYFCFSLALNQDIQEKAREEVDELFEDLNYVQNDEISFEAVQGNLKYLERCIQETLRLFPPIFVLARKLETPIEFTYKNKKVVIPTGTSVVIPPYIIHRKEEYFPNPNKFDPDRFLPEISATRHAYSYIPFSAGPRNCLGPKFAMMEMKIAAAHILRNFEMRTTDRMEDIPLLPNTTLTPSKDYTFSFKRRLV